MVMIKKESRLKSLSINSLSKEEMKLVKGGQYPTCTIMVNFGDGHLFVYQGACTSTSVNECDTWAQEQCHTDWEAYGFGCSENCLPAGS